MTVMTGATRVRDNARHADAILAELGKLGNRSVPHAKMPKFCVIEHAREERSSVRDVCTYPTGLLTLLEDVGRVRRGKLNESRAAFT